MRKAAPLWFAIAWVLVGAVGRAQVERKGPTPEQVLASYGVGTSSSALTEALTRPQALVRENAAILLGQRKDRSAAEALRGMLNDPYVSARLAAAEALLQIGDTSGLPTVRQLLKQDDPYSAVRAALVLADNGIDEGLSTVVEIARSAVKPTERLLAVRALPRFTKFESDKPIVLTELLNRFDSDSDLQPRRAAGSELMNFRNPEVVQAFQRAASDRDPVIRGLAESYLKKQL